MHWKKTFNTCLHSWFWGFPSLFVPSFLQMKGRDVLQGTSSQRAFCTQRPLHVSERMTLTPSRGRLSEVTHRTPHGDAVFLGVAEVVGFIRVPEGEDNGGVVGPLEVHLHFSVMEPYPHLVKVWRQTKKVILSIVSDFWNRFDLIHRDQIRDSIWLIFLILSPWCISKNMSIYIKHWT